MPFCVKLPVIVSCAGAVTVALGLIVKLLVEAFPTKALVPEALKTTSASALLPVEVPTREINEYCKISLLLEVATYNFSPSADTKMPWKNTLTSNGTSPSTSTMVRTELTSYGSDRFQAATSPLPPTT